MGGEGITRPVLLAETTLREVAAALDDHADPGALGRARQLYEALWAQLDEARAAALAAGHAVGAYDGLRATAPGDLFAAKQTPLPTKDGVSFVAHAVAGLPEVTKIQLDLSGLVIARQCAQALKEATPELPWREEQRQLDALGNTNVRSGRGVATFIILVVAAAVIYAVLWVSNHM